MYMCRRMNFKKGSKGGLSVKVILDQGGKGASCVASGKDHKCQGHEVNLYIIC